MGLIVNINDCYDAFENAYNHVWSGILNPDLIEEEEQLQTAIHKLWFEEFGILAHADEIHYVGLMEFRNQEHYIEWLLRWS